MPGCSRPVAAIHVAPGVPEIAATNRWVTAPMAWAASAVRSAIAERGWSQVDLLQRQHVGVEVPDGLHEPVQFDGAVVDAASVQDVEGGHPHGY